jgi:hypothetical protein
MEVYGLHEEWYSARKQRTLKKHFFPPGGISESRKTATKPPKELLFL